MNVLFVVACSLTKATGGAETFAEEAGVAALAPTLAERLTARRDEVRQLVKDGETADWQGVPLKELEYNRSLTRGTEFGGRKSAAYMPALERYEGRFFQALGDAGKAHCLSNQNLLIVSGLYGLLSAKDPTQLYSCPLSAAVADIWQCDALLTDIVRTYVQRNDILRVFDLTAMDAYRRLVDWERVASDGIDVLHCFDSMAAGESALTAFGRLLRHLVFLSDDELIALEPERRPEEFGTCSLHRTADAPPGYPAETWQINMAEEVLRGGNPMPGPWQFTMTTQFKRDASADLEATLEVVMEICKTPTVPRGDTVKRLSGQNRQLWRYRLGDYRVVYEPDSARRVVRFLHYGHRKEVYMRL